MKLWTKILPLFIIEWYAKRNMSVWEDTDGYFVYPYNGVKIYLEDLT